MKREQKAFVMLMAACMAFTGISSLMSASAAPVSLNQAQIGNYLDDGARNETSPAEIVLPSGRKVIKKTDASAPKTTARQPVDGGKRITDEADCPERGRRPDGVSGAG